MSDQHDLFQYLLRHPVDSPIGFETWLVGASIAKLRLERSEAEQLASTRKPWIWTAFAKYDQALRNRGCASAFQIVDENSRIFRTPTPDLSDSKVGRVLSGERHLVMRWIDALGDRKYEFLGGALAHFLGAKETYVSPGGGDGGVDFYALLPAWGKSTIFHSPQKYVRIVGQSKYYTGTVGTDETKLLVKTIDDIRAFTVEMSRHLPSWFQIETGPVVGAIVAPHGFQSGAVKRAHTNGVMLADNVDVAEAIISSRLYKANRMKGISHTAILNDAIAAVGWTA